MSSVAAVTAVGVPGPFLARTRLGPVPDQERPSPKARAGHPLALSGTTRARLRAAVHRLLDVAGLESASDAVRLAVVVLAARTPSESGVVEIRTSELGRWLGLSASYVASEVLPGLRRSGVVSVETAEGEFGQDDGLKCRVLPLWAAQDVIGHPLNLAKKELATLLRLLEAVMAPGWTHRDGRVTPAGLIGTRTGRGAARDRLALLLLALEARETGRVRLCGGAVDTRRGRAATTVARLLGCSASAGERVLERLEERGLVRRVRLQTGSGLAHRSRLMVPAVAAAHGRTGVDSIREDREEAPEPGVSDPDVAAGPGEAPEPGAESQVSSVPVAGGADVAEPDVVAALHTDHPHLVTAVSLVALSGGFSGEAGGGCGDLPDRARVREDQALGQADSLAEAGDVPVGPLRGDKQLNSPAWTSGITAGYPPADLAELFGMVPSLWEYLPAGGKRRLGVRLIRQELRRVTVQVASADEGRGPDPVGVLADRLRRRAAESGGVTAARDVIGWLKGRLLPQRGCGQDLCDDGTDMFSGQPCHGCAERIGDARDRREQVMAELDPRLPAAERKALCEARLAELDRARQEADVARQAEAAQRRAEVAARAAAAAADRKRRAAEEAARPCEDCDAPRAGGLCGACSEVRRTAAAVTRGVHTELVEWVLLHPGAGAGDVAERAAEFEDQFRAELESVANRQRAAGLVLAAETAVRLQAENRADSIQRRVLPALARADAAAAARAQAAADTALGNPQPEAERCEDCGTELTRGPRDVCLPCRQARADADRAAAAADIPTPEAAAFCQGDGLRSCGRPAQADGYCARHLIAVRTEAGRSVPGWADRCQKR